MSRGLDDGRLLRRVTVGDNVARSKGVDDLLHGDAGVADMNHHGRATSHAGPHGEAQRFPAVVTDGLLVNES
jgi:hypothetical protein